MAKFNDKISSIIQSQLPEFVVEQHPKFAEFLQTYYQLLESAELKVKSVQTTEGILLETETPQTNKLILDAGAYGTGRTQLHAGDNIALEESQYGKFTNGETITGQTSKATAAILTEDLVNAKLYISAQSKFINGETIIGDSSNANAIITGYSPAPVHNISDLTKFRDPDNTLSFFLSNFREEFLKTLPEDLAEGVDKRNLIKNVRSLYRAKGTQKGHELFFRLLFNEPSETIYPREQILRVSDGKWNNQKLIRTIDTLGGDTSDLIGRTITGQSSNATAIVENVIKFQIGAYDVSEFTINEESINGTFIVGEEIRGTESEISDSYIKATITGIPGNKIIQNDGSLYNKADFVKIVGGGNSAFFTIDSIGDGSIDEIIIDNSGTNYTIGDKLVFDNATTHGNGVAGFVSVVSGAVAGETDLGAEHIVLEDYTQIQDTYAGNKIVQEVGTGNGEITDVFISDGGQSYQNLPAITINTATGNSGILKAYGSQIGRITGIKTTELGVGYDNSPTPPQLQMVSNLILKGHSGTFVPGQIANQSGTLGTIKEWNANTGLLKVSSTDADYQVNQLITSGGAQGTIIKADRAKVSVEVQSVTDTDGRFVNEDGHVSENTMKIQDSLYYQDFSYVLKVARSINEWKDSFKKTMHTSGFYFTGQVQFESRLNLRMKTPVEGLVSGIAGTPIMSLFSTLFATLFGRRLGTETDGTSLRPKSHESVKVDQNTLTTEHFPADTRDVTFKRLPIEFDYTSRQRRRVIVPSTQEGVTVYQGFASAGPRFGTISKGANTVFGLNNPTAKIKFMHLEELEITGTRSPLNGTKGIFFGSSPENQDLNRRFRTRFGIPSYFAFDADTFDNTVQTFNTTSITWDDTTP